jgi:hypothetical protein
VSEVESKRAVLAIRSSLICFFISAALSCALVAGARLKNPMDAAIALVVPLCASMVLTSMALLTDLLGDPPRLSWPTTLLVPGIHGALTATVATLLLQIGTDSSASTPPRGLLPAAIWLQGPQLIVLAMLLQVAALTVTGRSKPTVI